MRCVQKYQNMTMSYDIVITSVITIILRNAATFFAIFKTILNTFKNIFNVSKYRNTGENVFLKSGVADVSYDKLPIQQKYSSHLHY